ncbi:MAG: HEAT repeat domain-containing protein [Chloroflexi bacterium]|nr:HEAT repeat domain-containing protein [Chloroflexota bacterium]
MSLEQLLAQLGSAEQMPTNVQLAALSGILPEDLAMLRDRWLSVDVGRRRQLCRRLADLAEESVELDFEEIFKLSLHDEDPEVRVCAIEGLWECEDRTLIPPLVSLLRTDGDSSVRAAAAQKLGQFAYRAEVNALRPRDAARVRTALLEVIDDADESVLVRRRAIEAISAQSDPRIQAIIEEAYQSDDPGMRASALFGMGRNCDSRWLPILIRELENPGAEMRFEAANALGEMEDQRAVLHLIPLLEDIDGQVQLAAVNALGRIGGRTAKQALRRCLRGGDDRLSQAARTALDELEFSEDPLTFSLTD